MPRAQWPLQSGRPVVPVVLTLAATGQPVWRILLADTGAGAAHVKFDLLLEERDCLACGGAPAQPITLGGAYAGSFPVYVLRVQIPAIGFDRVIRAVGASTVPPGLGGIACFPFLNRFGYGNFRDPKQFGLET
jgi:hypothetical protein